MMTFSSCTFATAVLVLLVGSTRAEKSDASCETSQAPASLMQKGVRRHAKGMISNQQPNVMECNGTLAQERCWFLSDMAKNCDDTCTRNGLGFAYVVADPDQPLMPSLVGHKPNKKQDAWAAFECYHPQEDRYHTADVNAVKHMLHDVAHWSHEGCKLACPCSLTDVGGQQGRTLSPLGPAEEDQEETPAPAPIAREDSAPLAGSASSPVTGAPNEAHCSWKQPPACAQDFMWKGVMYTGCATVDSEHEKPWCQHHAQHADGEVIQAASFEKAAKESTKKLEKTSMHEYDVLRDQTMHEMQDASQAQVLDWSYCNFECEADAPAPAPQDGCGWSPASSCVSEFDYEGTHYLGCTLTDHKSPWCSNSNPYQGSWSQCTYSCAAPQPIPEEEMQCTWEPQQECYLGGFEYKGVAYNGCADVDNPTPWCSHDKVHKGSWTACSRVCIAVQPTLPPSPISQTLAPTMAPPAPAPQTLAPTMAPPAPAPQTLEPTMAPPAPAPQILAPTMAPSAPAPQTPQPTTPAEDPCTRHPEAENDLIGASVALDEAGYKIAASAGSPINMKRFICRTVKEIECRVNDLSALMAFVPYYSGLVSDQSYAKLKTELEMICHVGGKWVEPIKSQ